MITLGHFTSQAPREILYFLLQQHIFMNFNVRVGTQAFALDFVASILFVSSMLREMDSASLDLTNKFTF